jgi:hypothetical protein
MRVRLLLVCLPLWGQASLQIRVVEGDGVVYTVGSRATRGVTVEVLDGGGKPVDGATVRFELPAAGPSGTFPDGQRTAAMTTGADGRVEAWGMQWNRTPGPMELRMIVSKGPVISNGRVGLALTSAPIAVDAAGPNPRHSHKKLWIALAVVGAGGVAILGLAGKSTSTPATPAAVNAPQIGAPTITIGAP